MVQWEKITCKLLFIFAQLAASLSLLSSYYYDEIKDIFIILPFCGLAFATFHQIPERMADLIEEKYSDESKGTYKQMLNLSLFLAQILMFLVVPLIFILYPDRDDNLWGMLSAGVTGLSAAVFILVV